MKTVDALFWRSFKLSFSAHFVFLVFALCFSFFSIKPKQIITSSIRVDLVGLPEMTKRDQQAEDKQEEAQIKKNLPLEQMVQSLQKKNTPPSKPSPLSKKQELKNAIERIRALEHIEDTVKKTRPIRGNIVAQGNSISEADQMQAASEFAHVIQQRLKAHWNLPIWLANKKLSAKAEIFLDSHGMVMSVVLMRRSGDDQFDDYVLKTIEKAQPFGTPPISFVGTGIELGFPL